MIVRFSKHGGVLLCFVLLLFACSVSGVAAAETVWRGTKWGMTPSLANKASGLTFQKKTNEDGVSFYESQNVKIGDHTYLIRMFFAKEKLERIVIAKMDAPTREAHSAFNDIKNSLQERFGRNGEGSRWQLKWFTPETAISLAIFEMGGESSLFLSYEKRKTGEKSKF